MPDQPDQPDRPQSKTASRPGRVERRRRPRPPDAAGDWETLALQRIARRVRSLPGGSAEAGRNEGTPGFGWEEAVLERLRRRIDGPDDF